MKPAPLSKTQRRVLDAISSGELVNLRSAESVARRLDISKRSYRRALKELVAMGLIARTPYRPREAYATPLFGSADTDAGGDESGQMATFDFERHPGEH